MIGLGAQATWVQINLISALANCNIVVPTVHKLAACTTTQEVAAIPVPNVTGVIGLSNFHSGPSSQESYTSLKHSKPLQTDPFDVGNSKSF
jgi:hypothetical protein